MAASGIITDVDQFTEPVRAPADGDPANGETFQDGLQDLANRTRNLKNRVDGLEADVAQRVVSGYGTFKFIDSAPATAVDLAAKDTSDDVSIDEDEITVSPGVWLVSVTAPGMEHASGTEGILSGFKVQVNGETQFAVLARTTKPGTTAQLDVSGSGIVVVEDPEHTIRLERYNGGETISTTVKAVGLVAVCRVG